MASWRLGEVVEVRRADPGIVEAVVEAGGTRLQAAGFPRMLGDLRPGDRVVLNTTGIDLGLGTGGVAFVLWNLDGAPPRPGPGHIVKLRYTPWQTEVPAVEAPESPHHGTMREAASVDGMPVVACPLHSQVAAAAAGIKAASPGARVGYLMTDGGALPIAFSNLVRALKQAGLVDVTATCGHAFGGDIEAVNHFSGLVALRAVGGCDAVVAGTGPGVVGTATRLGTTALEQGLLLDAASALGGRAIAALRVSFAEERPRHRGLSHHSATALTLAARSRATVAVPELPPAQARVLAGQLKDSGVAARHDLVTSDGAPGLELAVARGIELSSMGRPAGAVPELFLAAAAAGRLAGEGLVSPR